MERTIKTYIEFVNENILNVKEVENIDTTNNDNLTTEEVEPDVQTEND